MRTLLLSLILLWSVTAIANDGVPVQRLKITQDYAIVLGDNTAKIRLERGTVYDGKIYADHAEILIHDIWYTVTRNVVMIAPAE